MQEKKINASEFIINYSANRQKKTGNGDSYSSALMTVNNESLMKILSHEKEEIEELLTPNKQQKLILQKNK